MKGFSSWSLYTKLPMHLAPDIPSKERCLRNSSFPNGGNCSELPHHSIPARSPLDFVASSACSSSNWKIWTSISNYPQLLRVWMGLKPIRIFSIFLWITLLLALFASATLPILAMLNSSPRSFNFSSSRAWWTEIHYLKCEVFIFFSSLNYTQI